MALTQVQGQMLGGSSNTTTTIQSNGTTAITIDSSQNVGIGTSSPATLEHLSSNTNTQLRIETTNTGAIPVTQYKNAEGNVHQIGSETSAGNGGFNGSSAYALCLEAVGSRDICFSTGSALSAKITSAGLMQFNSGYGSVATAYGCRAWVNFNGTGTVAIRASGNVSSISDYGTGNYGVNFTNSMPNTNYAVTAGLFLSTDTPQVLQVREYFTNYATLIISQPGVANYDSAYVSVAVHR